MTRMVARVPAPPLQPLGQVLLLRQLQGLILSPQRPCYSKMKGRRAMGHIILVREHHWPLWRPPNRYLDMSGDDGFFGGVMIILFGYFGGTPFFSLRNSKVTD